MRAQSTLLDRGNGTCAGNIDLGSGGMWQVTVTATKDDQTIAGKRYNVSLSGPVVM